MEERVFDSIVAGLYRAASCEITWEQALEGVRCAFSARLVFLHSTDGRDGRIISIRYGGQPSNDSVLEYVRQYHQYDPRRSAVLKNLPALTGTWWHCEEQLANGFIEQHRFYREFLSSYNARFTSLIPLAPCGPADPMRTALVLELSKARGTLSPDEREQARRLGYHVLEALRMYERVRSLVGQALAGYHLLKSFSYPMWLLDVDRQVTFENQAAVAEQTAGARIARREGRLVLVRNQCDRRFTDVIHGLFQKDHGSVGIIDMRSNSAQPPTWLHLAVLAPAAALGAFGERRQVLATLFDPTHISPLDPFALSNMFRFTPSEAKVAACLGNGLTAAQIGRELGTSESTVRSQIRGVLQKLCAPRIADVVRVLRQGEALWARAGERLL